MEVNTIITIFGRNTLSEAQNEAIYTSDKITPEQQSLLDGNNPHQYPAEREIIDGKGNVLLSDKQGDGAESSIGERISERRKRLETSPLPKRRRERTGS